MGNKKFMYMEEADGTELDTPTEAEIRTSDIGGRHAAYSFTEGQYPYVTESKTSYTVRAIFNFPGTNDFGSLDRVVALISTSGGTGFIKIYDVTNSNTIFEETFTNTTLAPLSVTALSNIPTGEAVFEVQLKSEAGKKIYFANIQLERD